MLFKLIEQGDASPFMEGYQSGQMGRAVNPLTSVFEGSNPSPSTICKFINGVLNLGVAGVVQW